MNPEMYVVICIVSFLVLSILYLCAVIFCQWLFSNQRGLKLIGFGLLTTVASIGYATIDQIAGQVSTSAIHFQQNGMSTVTGTGASLWPGAGSGASMILCRLGVILVLSGVVSLLLEPGRKSCSGASDSDVAVPPEGLNNA